MADRKPDNTIPNVGVLVLCIIATRGCWVSSLVVYNLELRAWKAATGPCTPFPYIVAV